MAADKRIQVLASLLLLGAAGCGAPTVREDLAMLRQALPEEALLPDGEGSSDLAASLSVPLTVRAAQQIALEHNPRLRTVLAELGMTRDAWSEAESMPAVEVTGGYRRSRDETLLTGGISLSIVPLIERSERLGIARSEHAAARARAGEALLRLLFEVQVGAVEVLAASEQARLADDLLAVADAEREAAEVLFAAGNLPEYDRSLHRVNAETATAVVLDAQRAAERSRHRFELLLGIPIGAFAWTLRPLPPSDAAGVDLSDSVDAEVEAANLDLAARRATLEAAAHKIGRAETARWLPGLRLGVEAEQGASGNSFGPQLSVEIPMTGDSVSEVAMHQHAFDAALGRYAAARSALRAESREAQAELRTAAEISRRMSDRLVPLEEHLLQQDTLRYNAMEEGVFGLLEQRRRTVEAQISALQARVRAWSAEARWAFLRAGGSSLSAAEPSDGERSTAPPLRAVSSTHHGAP